MKKIAIIGASYLQLPLIKKAKEMGLETHVFAWASEDVGEKEADYFYPISIVEKEKILVECEKIGISGICTIASDLAIITVNYVANKLGLIGNSLECTLKSTNKYFMRKCFNENGDPYTHNVLVDSAVDIDIDRLKFPVIVKPIDRSGSRGITKVENRYELESAIQIAKSYGFDKKVIVEDYIDGEEYSVECLSYDGKHRFLQLTYKYTTGSPNYIEICHLEPAPVSEETLEKIKVVVFHALDSLGIKYGASHTEIKIDNDGEIKLIEIGGRMGGDLIGSSLVKNSTGYDFVRGVIEVSLGYEPKIDIVKNNYSAVRYIFSKDDLSILQDLQKNNEKVLLDYKITGNFLEKIIDSSNRYGYFMISSSKKEDVYQFLPYLPKYR